jgi:hypothetical protein
MRQKREISSTLNPDKARICRACTHAFQFQHIGNGIKTPHRDAVPLFGKSK